MNPVSLSITPTRGRVVGRVAPAVDAWSRRPADMPRTVSSAPYGRALYPPAGRRSAWARPGGGLPGPHLNMASRTKQKEEARARRLAEEQARSERARRQRRVRMLAGVIIGAVAVVAVLIAVSVGN